MNENSIVSAFTSDDLFQKKNIVTENKETQQKAKKHLKALIQSYYNHVSAKNYVVK